MNGMIMSVVATASETAVPANYYLEIEFPAGAAGANDFEAGLDSGLVTGSDYPAVVTVPSSGTIVKLDFVTDSTLTVVTSTVNAGDPIVNFITTVSAGADATKTDAVAGVPVFSVYTLAPDDARDIHLELYYENGSLDMAGAASSLTLAFTARSAPESYTNGD